MLSSSSENLIDVLRERYPELKFYTSKLVLDELNRLASGKTKVYRYASMALKLISNFEVITSGKDDTDEDILESAIRFKLMIATTDSELRRRAKLRGIPIIFLKKDGYLSLE